MVYPRINNSLHYLTAMICISVMVWTCFYPGNPLHAVSLKVGLVMDDFGMHDRSYNQLAYQGLVQAEKELGIKGSAVSAAKEEDYSKIIGRYVQGGYELVIGNVFRDVSIQWSQFHTSIFKIINDLPRRESALKGVFDSLKINDIVQLSRVG